MKRSEEFRHIFWLVVQVQWSLGVDYKATVVQTQKWKLLHNSNYSVRNQKSNCTYILELPSSYFIFTLLSYLFYPPPVRINGILSYRKKIPSPPTSATEAWEKEQWKPKRKNILSYHCCSWPRKKQNQNTNRLSSKLGKAHWLERDCKWLVLSSLNHF